MSGGDQQAPQVAIPRLADPQFWVRVAGLEAMGNQAKVRPDIPAPAKALWVVDRQRKAECRQVSDARDLSNRACSGVILRPSSGVLPP